MYRIEVRSKPNFNDARRAGIANDIRSLGIHAHVAVDVAVLYFLDGELDDAGVNTICERLLCDSVVQTYQVVKSSGHQVDFEPVEESSGKRLTLRQAQGKLPSPLHPFTLSSVEVTFKAGVTDATADEIARASHELGIAGLHRAATGTRYELAGELDAAQMELIARRLLCNDVIQAYAINRAIEPNLHYATAENTLIETVALRDAGDDDLIRISKERRLSLNLDEMRAIRSYFNEIQREPTDAEVETLAQTWSEHCVHKTFKARIQVDQVGQVDQVDQVSPVAMRDLPDLTDLNRPVTVDGLLKTYIKKATDEIAAPWVKSAFVDNAGIIEFDDDFDLSFKAETHNHPSAIEPFGGANTGVGGVIRDVIAVSARPIANTDVLCFGPQDADFAALPEGVLHPRRVMQGVVAGVEDYGNKMGIPTVSGAIVYDEGYTANPLVYCGCVGIAPVNSHPRNAQAGDRVVVLGGRTGRDGLRGATFSSAALTHETSDVAGSSVQIGNPIIEKNVMEVVLAARDAKLYNAITDCGAGGLSSAVGEMGAELGVQVQLECVPLKYAGLAPWEIWLSEAQERMVLAVAPDKLDALRELCARFDCEMSDIGAFTGDGHLRVNYRNSAVCDMRMDFLHDGLPRRELKAVVSSQEKVRTGESEKGRIPPSRLPTFSLSHARETLKQMLAHPNVASKEDVIRLYDHEVQGGSVIKPLVGVGNHGPSDATVIKPLGTQGAKGFALACGINPNLGKVDAYAMAVSAIDEAVRNLVCAGANPDRIALLDNFCWGDPNDPETLGTLVEACRGCYDGAMLFQAPFISGKDSLNNTYFDKAGRRVSIPATLLISALGIVDDVARCVTMDLKRAGSRVYLLGETKDELAGSLFEMLTGETMSSVPTLPADAPALYRAVHTAIQQRLILAAHDCSEGGLAVTLAEMAQAGQIGIQLDELGDSRIETALFSESNGRIVVEVSAENAPAFEQIMQGLPAKQIGTTQAEVKIVLPDGSVLWNASDVN
jgi:phosphoribosylformylglycinamidine synthase